MPTTKCPPMVMLTITMISEILGCDPCFLIWLIEHRLACSPYHGPEPEDDTLRLLSLEEAAYCYRVFSRRLQAGESEEDVVRYLVSGAPDDPDALSYAAEEVNGYLQRSPEFSLC